MLEFALVPPFSQNVLSSTRSEIYFTSTDQHGSPDQAPVAPCVRYYRKRRGNIWAEDTQLPEQRRYVYSTSKAFRSLRLNQIRLAISIKLGFVLGRMLLRSQTQ